MLWKIHVYQRIDNNFIFCEKMQLKTMIYIGYFGAYKR